LTRNNTTGVFALTIVVKTLTGPRPTVTALVMARDDTNGVLLRRRSHAC
jgi:hypothetical protein